MDDGGNIYLNSIHFLNEGLEKIFLLKSNKIESISLAREAWRADFSVDCVEIYSLYDERESEIISLKSMKMALLEWREFLQSKPSIDISLELDLNSA